MAAGNRRFVRAALALAAFFALYSAVISFCHTERTIEERASCPACHFFGLFMGAAAAEASIVFALIALWAVSRDAPRFFRIVSVLGYSLRGPPAA